jgi:hypothetical protein
MLNRKNERKFRSHSNRRKLFVDAVPQCQDGRTPIHVFEERASQGLDLFTGKPLIGWEWDSWLELNRTGRDLVPVGSEDE